MPLAYISGSTATSLAPTELTVSRFAEPQLVGETNLCIVFGGVSGIYSGGGDPNVDFYEWQVTNGSGEVIFNRSAGAQAETIQVIYSEIGTYNVQLKVRRGTDYIYEETLVVTVKQGPTLALQPDYLLCAGAPTLLTALDPNTPNLSEFTIIWKNIEDTVIGTGNEFLTYSEGYHLVEIFQTDASGNSSCVIDGSTFVGPPIDFQLVTSSQSICEGESIHVSVDTPISGDWFVQKDFTGARSQIGSGFEIEISSSELSGPGLYLVTFEATTEDFPNCVSSKIVGFELLEAPKITATASNQPSDCAEESGFLQITFDTDVDAFHIPELNVSEGAKNAGEVVSYSNIKSRVYSLVMEKNGCQVTKLLVMEAENPPTLPSPPGQDPVLLTEETCSPTGITPGKVTLDFGGPVAAGEYRILVDGRGEITRGAIPASGQAEFPLRGGRYMLEITLGDCNSYAEYITIPRATQVEFTVPSELNICETFTLVPETDQDLIFSLTLPDGSTQTFNSGESITLTEEGSYSILGESTDPNSEVCPKQVDFNATLSSNITFAPVLAVEKCFDPIRYQIDLEGIPLEEASIRWYNDQGKIVGRGKEFYPPSVGLYSLLVQPLKSGFCAVAPIDFEVVAPVTSVPMELETEKLCPQPNTSTITLTTDENEVTDTEWIFYDLQGNRQELGSLDDLFEIEVDAPGTYEVVAYNELGCEIGRNLIPVEESQLVSLPVLEERYGVCTSGKTGPNLNPGDYAEYYWYLDDQLVSEDPIFTPKDAGSYTLKVVTEDGCEFTGSFETFDACSFDYVFPNAMTLGDPLRNFEVRVSEGITEVELHILNRQGALIHFGRAEEIVVGEPILEWDGTTNGTYIPSGTYVVVLIGRNPLFQFEQKITGSLLVLE
ncbi:hypothetical protein GCM10027454_01320 [Algoriphagus aestuariicola]